MSRANSNDSFIPNCVIPEDEIEMESEEEYPDSQLKHYDTNEPYFSRYLTPININISSSMPSNKTSLSESPTNISKFLFEVAKKSKQKKETIIKLSSENLSIELSDNLPPIAPTTSNISINSKLRGRRVLRNIASLEFSAYSNKFPSHQGNSSLAFNNLHLGHPHYTAPATPTNWKEDKNRSLIKNFPIYFSTVTLKKRSQQQIALSPSLSRRFFLFFQYLSWILCCC